MPAVNQDFVTFGGDTIKPIFLVQNNATPPVAVDISTASEISWFVRVNEVQPILVTKKKSLGQIAFVTNGTDGQFQVTILAADTNLLNNSGDFFLHYASVTDAGGNVTTVSVGRMQVGTTPQWTYNPGLIASQPLYQVRYLIGDVIESDRQLFDAEINFSLTQYSTVLAAAAECARTIAAKYARKSDVVQGELRTQYSQQSRAYGALARDLEQRGLWRGATPFAGGISITTKTNTVNDPDRVPPSFNVEMFDNTLPVGPVGQQTLTPGSPDLSSSDNFPI